VAGEACERCEQVHGSERGWGCVSALERGRENREGLRRDYCYGIRPTRGANVARYPRLEQVWRDLVRPICDVYTFVR
jgi:hypothetical protein